jgi:DNA (cytosine-5)-methyltransferase 1
MKEKKITLFEAFAWIWSQHQALKELWYSVDVIWISEWYIDALLWYNLYHTKFQHREKYTKLELIEKLNKYTFSNNSKIPLSNLKRLKYETLSILEQFIEKYWELDINKIKWNFFIWKDLDLFTYSFPCQDISQQWKQSWFWKNSNTRSGLLWQIERILKEIKNKDKKSLPKVLLMENVKSLLSKSFEKELNEWVSELENLWYTSTKPFVINSSDINSPQNRERVFMISILNQNNENIKDINNILNYFTKENLNIDLLKNKKQQVLIKDIYDFELSHQSFNLKKNINIIHNVNKTDKWIKKWFLENNWNFNSENYFYYLDWKSPTITSSGAQSRIKVWDWTKLIILNAFEHLKLQWFNNKEIYNQLIINWLSEQKIKFLAWNSINVDVLKYIFKKIFK